MKNKMKIIFSTIAATFLIGCGGGGGGGGSTHEATTSGTVSDGYLYSAKVCYKGTNICTKTDKNGKFTLPQKNLPIVAFSDENTTNTANYKHFSSVLVAPAGITKITPLSTALYALNNNYDLLAKDLNISVDVVKQYINKDYVSLSVNDKNASKLYGKSIVLEQLTQALMLDSNISDLDKKIIALKVMLKYSYNNDKSLKQLTAEDLKNVFAGFKSLVYEPAADINKTKISVITEALAGSLDANFSVNAIAIEKQIAILDLEKMITLDETNLTNAANALKTIIVSITNPDKAINAVAASNQLKDYLRINVPEINAIGYVYIKNLSTEKIKIVKGDEFNITAGAVYNAALENASSNFITFENGSQVLVNQNSDITLKIDPDKMVHSIERVELKLTPVNGNVVGETKSIMILVKKPNELVAGIVGPQSNENENEKEYNITLTADNTHELNETQKPIDINITDPEESYFVFATSSNSKVVSIEDINNTDVILNPISNGFAKVTVISMNKNTYEPTFQIYNITVENVDLPPVLKVEKTYYEVPLIDGNADVNISYSVIDSDDVNNGFEINASCGVNSTDIEGNLTCGFTDVGLHKIILTASDGYLSSTPITVYVNVFQGNVAPKLNVFVPDEVEMNTMSSVSYDFSASDLNGADTFKVYATSDDNTTVKVSIDQNESKIILVAQPKAGTAHISVWAKDNGGLKSSEYTFTVTTKNEMASLMPALYLVPPIDSNGSLIDTRYKFVNFNAGYDIADDVVLINGEINTTDGNVTLNDFELKSYPDDAVYAGKDTTPEGRSYAFVFSNGFEYDGQFKDGRVLVFDENGLAPYYWALATKKEICEAFGDNNNTINLINSLNDKEPIDCKEE